MRSVGATGGASAVPRQAASVIVLEDTSRGPRVLLAKRNPSQRFMGGVWVFPGGALAGDGETHDACAARELEEEAGIRIDPRALVAFSRWITPPQAQIRFDTLFFVAAAPPGQTPKADGSECVKVCWLAPADALARHTQGQLELVFPTIKQLEQLAQYPSTDAILAAAPRRSIEPITPRIVTQDGHRVIVLPGEKGYDS